MFFTLIVAATFVALFLFDFVIVVITNRRQSRRLNDLLEKRHQPVLYLECVNELLVKEQSAAGRSVLLLDYAVGLSYVGKFEEAREVLLGIDVKSVGNQPKDVFYFTLALCYLFLNQWEEAEQTVNQFTALKKPSLLMLRRIEAIQSHMRNENEESRQALESIIRSAQQKFTVEKFLLALTYYREGNAHYKELFEVVTNDAPRSYFAYVLNMKLGHDDVEYREALQAIEALQVHLGAGVTKKRLWPRLLVLCLFLAIPITLDMLPSQAEEPLPSSTIERHSFFGTSEYQFHTDYENLRIESQSSETTVYFYTYSEDQDLLRISHYPVAARDISQMIDAEQVKKEPRSKNVEVLEMSIGKEKAVSLGIEYTENNTHYWYQDIMLVHEGEFYLIHAQALLEHKEQVMPVFDSIIKSFEFVPIEGEPLTEP